MKKTTISSSQNTKLKHVKRLIDDKQYRYDCKEFVIEGLRALDNLKEAKEIFLREGVDTPLIHTENLYILPENIFKLISSTENSQGIVAIAEMNLLSAQSISKTGRYLLLDRIQDPGNMGTMIRTACAFNFNGIIITAGTVDPFSPKVARSASSAVGLVDLIRIDSIDQLSGYTILAADMFGKDINSFTWPKNFILVIGNEASGVSQEFKNIAKETLSIPISLKIESLNAAVSAGIIMYASSGKLKQ